MKKYFLLSLFCLILNIKANAQSFTIHLSPDTLVIPVGQTDTLNLSATPSGGYNASIFLSLQSFSSSLVTISPSIFNFPYSNGKIVVSASNLGPGIHKLIIKGAQGAIESYDTAIINVVIDPNLKWYQFKKENSGLLWNDLGAITFDMNNNLFVTTSNSSSYISERGLCEYDHLGWSQWNYNSYKETDFLGNTLSLAGNSMLGFCSGLVDAVAVDNNGIKWIGTESGLIRLDSTSYTVLFPNEFISKISIYKNKICVGTEYNGFRYFDGSNWYSFTTANSYLPSNTVKTLAFESDSNLWIGTINGLAHFDFQNWTIYNPTNSILPHTFVTAIEIDKFNNKWVSTLGSGLIKYNNLTWQSYQPPCAEISAICADYAGAVWLGFQSGNTDNALAKFDGTNWTIFNSANSGFKSDATTLGYGRIRSIEIDALNTVWISTFGDGLFAYNVGGLDKIIPASLIHTPEITKVGESLFKIYPNPSSGKFSLVSGSAIAETFTLNLQNIQGSTLFKSSFFLDAHETKQFDFGALENGVYFIVLSSATVHQTQKLLISGK